MNSKQKRSDSVSKEKRNSQKKYPEINMVNSTFYNMLFFTMLENVELTCWFPGIFLNNKDLNNCVHT